MCVCICICTCICICICMYIHTFSAHLDKSAENQNSEPKLLDKLIGSQLVKKFPVFNGIGRFITVLTCGRQLSVS